MARIGAGRELLVGITFLSGDFAAGRGIGWNLARRAADEVDAWRLRCDAFSRVAGEAHAAFSLFVCVFPAVRFFPLHDAFLQPDYFLPGDVCGFGFEHWFESERREAARRRERRLLPQDGRRLCAADSCRWVVSVFDPHCDAPDSNLRGLMHWRFMRDRTIETFPNFKNPKVLRETGTFWPGNSDAPSRCRFLRCFFPCGPGAGAWRPGVFFFQPPSC